MIIDCLTLEPGWYRITRAVLDGVEVPGWWYADTEAGILKALTMSDGKRYVYRSDDPEKLAEFLAQFPDAEPMYSNGEVGPASRTLRGAIRFRPAWEGRYNGPQLTKDEMKAQGYTYWWGWGKTPVEESNT